MSSMIAVRNRSTGPLLRLISSNGEWEQSIGKGVGLARSKVRCSNVGFSNTRCCLSMYSVRVHPFASDLPLVVETVLPSSFAVKTRSTAIRNVIINYGGEGEMLSLSLVLVQL